MNCDINVISKSVKEIFFPINIQVHENEIHLLIFW